MPKAGPDLDLLNWGLPRLRSLPWRDTRDPWAILTSEVMLQQTQTARVIPKWLAFLEAFPTAQACAAASLGDVLRHWQGLGYPRRARNLHGAAVMITADLGGAFPDTLAGLLALPGVGPYTARAVLAFAFESDAAIVDTNVARVLARVTGRRLGPKEVQVLADSWLPAGEAWSWNQMMLDLGATVCGPRAPRCDACPLSSRCGWRGDGPDPVIGSAGVSTAQARFEGSDRQVRGRLVRRLGDGSLTAADVAVAGGIPTDADRAARLIQALVAEGLAVITADGHFALP